MINKDKSNRRITFQGVINAQLEKVPEKNSRSKSKNRSKASSISRSSLALNQPSFQKNQKNVTSKVQRKGAKSKDDQHISKTASQSIFRSSKRNSQQQIMKKIIKLKNQTIKIQQAFKQPHGQSGSVVVENKENLDEVNRLQEMENKLQEVDMHIRRSLKEIGDRFMHEIQNVENEFSADRFVVPQYKPLMIPHSSSEMPNLQQKLQQIEQKWLSK